MKRRIEQLPEVAMADITGVDVYKRQHLYLALLVMDSFPGISDTGEMALVNILASMMSLLIRKVKF